MRLKQTKNIVPFQVFSCACLLALSITPTLTRADVIVIGVASTKEVKIKPVREAFTEIFPNDTLQILPFKAGSDIADQPVGEQWGIQGTLNRIENAKREHAKNLAAAVDAPAKPVQYWVAIENYIEPSKDDAQTWVDIGAVTLENVRKNSTLIQLSKPVSLDALFAGLAFSQTPSDYVHKHSGFSVTSGKAIKHYYHDTQQIELDDGNWHAHPDFGGVSRAELLKEAVLKVVRDSVTQD